MRGECGPRTSSRSTTSRKLPFTDKTTLRDTYPFGLFAVPLDDVVRIHSSSGTTGKPIVVGYTKGDIATWTELTARVASAAGVVHTDRAQMAFGYGMFTGGFGMHYGLERVGATVIPASAGNTERHLMMMQDFGTTVLVSTPSYALYIAEVAETRGRRLRRLCRSGWGCSVPSRAPMRRGDEIEAKLHISATDNYGLSEVMGPGVSGECECRCGLHINEDHFLVELVDPRHRRAGRPVGRVSSSSPRSPRRPSRCCATGRTTSRGSTTSRASADGRSCGWRRCASAPTTCSSSVA